MIAPMFLGNDADDGFATKPFASEEATASVGGIFIEARRFDFDQFAEGGEHLGKLRAKKRKKHFGEWRSHGEG
jgi:hypothetical protein